MAKKKKQSNPSVRPGPVDVVRPGLVDAVRPSEADSVRSGEADGVCSGKADGGLGTKKKIPGDSGDDWNSGESELGKSAAATASLGRLLLGLEQRRSVAGGRRWSGKLAGGRGWRSAGGEGLGGED
ncbi:unnamed protein product [Linum trigynum]|uniref:Uncharacterized protein n=1 Tax=Linum trigynum TaxID=586398 RepID=A0AAV2GL05_9ROSI